MTPDRKLISAVFSDEMGDVRIGILQLYDCPRCNEKRCVKISKGQLSLFKEHSENVEDKERDPGVPIEITHRHYTPNGDYHVMNLVFDKDVKLLNTYERYFERKG